MREAKGYRSSVMEMGKLGRGVLTMQRQQE